MGLIVNYRFNNNVAGHYFGGETNPIQWVNPHTMRSLLYYSPDIKRDSIPTGTEIPYSLVIGDKGANISNTTYTLGQATITANMAQGVNISSTINGIGDMTGGLSLIVQLAATLLGSSDLTANMVGTVQMAAELIGQGNVTAGLNLIANIASNIDGIGAVVADIKGKASMSATIYVNQSEATVQQIVDAVWNALAVEYNNPGTMGELLNGAGSAGNPWLSIIEGSYTAGDILKLLVAVAAGKTSISGTTVTFRDINDTKNRVVASMTGSERTTVTKDIT